MKSLLFLIIPIFLCAQTYKDRIVLKSGKSYFVQVKNFSDEKIEMIYGMGKTTIYMNAVDSLFMYPHGLIYTDDQGFIVDFRTSKKEGKPIVKSSNRLPKKPKTKRRFFQTIHLRNGKEIEGQLLRVTGKYLFVELQDKMNNPYYHSFVKDSVLLVDHKGGYILFKKGKLQVNELAPYYNPIYKQATKTYEAVNYFPGLRLEFSYSTTLTRLDGLEKYALSLFNATEQENFHVPEIAANYHGMDLAFLIDINSFISIGLTGKIDFTSSGEDNYYRIAFTDLRWFVSENEFRPWIGVGYASLSISQHKEIGNGEVYKFTFGTSSPLIGFGFERKLNSTSSLIAAYRYIPFSKEKIQFPQVENPDKEFDFTTHHLSFGFNFKF